MDDNAVVYQRYAQEAAEKFLNQNIPLNDTIAKIAKENRLAEEEIRRIVGYANKIVFLKLYASTEEKDKINFPLADADEIFSMIPELEKAQERANAASNENLTNEEKRSGTVAEQEKTASAIDSSLFDLTDEELKEIENMNPYETKVEAFRKKASMDSYYVDEDMFIDVTRPLTEEEQMYFDMMKEKEEIKKSYEQSNEIAKKYASLDGNRLVLNNEKINKLYINFKEAHTKYASYRTQSVHLRNALEKEILRLSKNEGLLPTDIVKIARNFAKKDGTEFDANDIYLLKGVAEEIVETHPEIIQFVKKANLDYNSTVKESLEKIMDTTKALLTSIIETSYYKNTYQEKEEELRKVARAFPEIYSMYKI